jgi:HEAT repeat protein
MANPHPRIQVSPEEVIRLLTVALRNLSMYTHEHPAFLKIMEQLIDAARTVLTEKDRLALQVVRDQVLADQRVLPSSPLMQGFAAHLLQRGIQGITLMRGVSQRELVALLDVLIRKPQEDAGGATHEETLRRKGVARIWIHPLHVGLLHTEQSLGEALLERLMRGQMPGAEGRDALAEYLVRDPQGMGRAVTSGGPSEGIDETDRARWVSERLLVVVEQLLAGHPEEWDRLKDRLSHLVLGLDAQPQLEFLRQSLTKGGEAGDWARGLAETFPRNAVVDLLAREVMSPRPQGEKVRFYKGLIPDPLRRVALRPEVEQKLAEYGVSREEFLRLMGDEEPTMEERFASFLQGPGADPGDFQWAPSIFQSLLDQGKKEEALRVLNRFFNALNHPEWKIRKEVAASLPPMLEALAKLYGSTGRAARVREFVLRKMLTEPDKEVFRLLSEGLEAMAKGLLKAGEVGQAVEILQKIDSALEASDLERAYLTSRREGIQKCLTEGPLLDQQMDALTRGTETEVQRALQVIRMIGDEGVRRIIEALGEVRQVSRRLRLFRALKDLGGVAVEPLKRSLQDSRWYLVRNAVMVLAEIKDPRVAPQLVALLNHPESRVRKEVVRALGSLASPKAQEGILRALEDEDDGVRLKALDVLQVAGGSAAKERLRQIVAGTGLRSPRETAMRVRALRALGALGGGEEVPLLAALLERKGLFSKMELDEIRRAAVMALTGIVERTESETAFQALQGAAQSDPSEEIRKTAEQCLAPHLMALMKTQPL